MPTDHHALDSAPSCNALDPILVAPYLHCLTSSTNANIDQYGWEMGGNCDDNHSMHTRPETIFYSTSAFTGTSPNVRNHDCLGGGRSPFHGCTLLRRLADQSSTSCSETDSSLTFQLTLGFSGDGDLSLSSAWCICLIVNPASRASFTRIGEVISSSPDAYNLDPHEGSTP
jgi:hypothetical protein